MVLAKAYSLENCRMIWFIRVSSPSRGVCLYQWFLTRVPRNPKVPPVQSSGSASLHLNPESSLLLYAYCLKIQ